jgi:hypothetical protein
VKALPQFRNIPFLLLAIFAVPDASSQLLKKWEAAERKNGNLPVVKHKTEELNL